MVQEKPRQGDNGISHQGEKLDADSSWKTSLEEEVIWGVKPGALSETGTSRSQKDLCLPATAIDFLKWDARYAGHLVDVGNDAILR